MAQKGDLAAKLDEARVARVSYEYVLPASTTAEGKPVTIVMVELTSRDELLASKRAQNQGMRLAMELAKMSLVKYGDEALTTADGSADRKWETLPPKARNLVLQAYADLHAPNDTETAVFLKGRKVQVG